MIPAPTLESIVARAMPGHGQQEINARRRRLVSVLFATPDTATFASLRANIAYFDARSGDMWDLAVAG